jgi:hypothetical protein
MHGRITFFSPERNKIETKNKCQLHRHPNEKKKLSDSQKVKKKEREFCIFFFPAALWRVFGLIRFAESSVYRESHIK